MAKLAKARAHTAVIRFSTGKRTPKATQFLANYFALDRPNTSHLFFSKGVVDFLLGLIIGILAGLIIAIMVGVPPPA